MSTGNIGFEMQNGKFPVPSASPTKVVNVEDSTYGSVCMIGYVAPSANVSTENTDSGFGVGCILVDVTNGKLYKNTGTTATASFTEITS